MSGFEWINAWGPEAQKAFAARRAAGLPPLCIATRTADGARCGLPDAHAGRCEPRVEEPAAPPPSPYEEAVSDALRAVQMPRPPEKLAKVVGYELRLVKVRQK